MAGRPDTVVARLAHHFGLRVYGDAPPCHTCQHPLHLADVQVSMPTGHCRSCAPAPAVPAPRQDTTHFVAPPAATRNGGGR
jgi:hypothetical protein